MDETSELFDALDRRMLLTLDLLWVGHDEGFNDLSESAQANARGLMHLGASCMLELVKEWGWLKDMED